MAYQYIVFDNGVRIGEMTAGEICELTGLKPSNVTKYEAEGCLYEGRWRFECSKSPYVSKWPQDVRKEWPREWDETVEKIRSEKLFHRLMKEWDKTVNLLRRRSWLWKENN